MKLLTLLAVLGVAGCGGGSGAQAPVAVVKTQYRQGHNVVFIGDSITAWWNVKSYVGPEAYNVGIGRQTSAQMRARFMTDVVATDAATVVILAGTNDIILNQDPSTQDIEAMVEDAVRAGMHVIMCEIPPNTDMTVNLFHGMSTTQAEVNSKIDAYNLSLIQIAMSRGIPIADYYDAMTDPDGEQNATLFVDGIHPNTAGYSVMWDTLKPILDPLL